MTVRRLKLGLNVAAAALWAAAVGVVAAAVWVPAELPALVPSRAATRPTTAATTEPFDFGDLADFDLRKPLETEAVAVPAVTTLRLPLNLKGTVVEPGHAYAILTGPTGETELKRVGERSGEATVESIGDGTVTLRAGGRQIVMAVPHPPAMPWGR